MTVLAMDMLKALILMIHLENIEGKQVIVALREVFRQEIVAFGEKLPCSKYGATPELSNVAKLC